MEKYTTLDFELANRHPSSICAIGMCVVENNKIIKTFYSLVRPAPFFVEKGSYKVHRINIERMYSAPTFDKIWEQIKPYIENSTIVAHNIQQDSLFLRAVLDYYHIPYPHCNMSCTFVLARKLLEGCRSYKLDGIADYFHLNFNHHHALEDALMCVRIIKRLKSIYHVKSLDMLHQLVRVSYGTMSPGYYRNIYVSDVSNNLIFKEENITDINENIYHQCICFDSINQASLKKLREHIVEMGGFVQDKVNINTNYLVTNQNKLTNNLIKAKELVNKGQDLKIISYKQFLLLFQNQPKKETS